MALIETARDGLIGTIVLDHAAKRNALSSELIGEICAALVMFRAENLRAVVIRARPGVKVWSAGFNIAELPEGHRDPLGWDDPVRHLVREIARFPMPVIAMVEGGVWGGACEVVLACDIIVIAPTASFAITPAKLSVPYNISGMLTFLNAAPACTVREMAFTAKPVGAARAYDLGMVNHLVPIEELESVTYGIARDIVANAPLAVSVMKEQLRILEAAHPVSPEGFERLQGLRRVVYDSRDYQEGLRAFKEKRKPQFEGM
ncbi:methylmalonyl-CoA decarboxylase [Rhodoplanes serenus]|uniref:methylmalonyl-CoA decarboxylase n=1 Tax=Rhodoplanes serenus TaxID=200615 RepID=UPI000DADBFC6|nr:methylmalonyl-CoA decarboxylase [Rhodoplanes serenus]RAI32879.1 methylmalonyl-CoA decarboxylase [Rhodoplanes serenus]